MAATTIGVPGHASVLLLGRDLRIADHPALAAAATAPTCLVLFVLDEQILRCPTTGPNRLAFLLDSLADLRASLRARGGELFVRRGDPAAVAVAAARAIGARTIHLSSDVTTVARRRRRALAERCRAAGIELVEHPGIAVVDPGGLHPTGGDHYRVFTPYWRAWSAAPRRPLAPSPERLSAPNDLDPGVLPDLAGLDAGTDPVGRHDFAPLALAAPSPRRDMGGESEAWWRLETFSARGGLEGYDSACDDLASDATARVAAHVHFGCVSPRLLEQWAVDHADGYPAAGGVAAFVRQLCWRDFFLAVTRSFPAIGRADYRARPVEWRKDPGELDAWKQGRTGVSLVDAAMRQLLDEGFVHNRARLVASSYLVKTLRHHWSEGAAHYLYWLSDGDVASNSGNWQWMAGTGNDTRPNRVLNPERQAKRFDPDGAYRSRYLGPPPWTASA
jgi:deoxyribodipyrimidine photo-lyase